MFEKSLTLAEVDSDIANAITAEEARQEAHIELIASENYTSTAVMIAQGSQLTNKYAEGYPYKRYYGGCEHVDVVEQLAVDRAKALFNADYANVQPHSGSQANAAVFQALLVPGDTILGMSLAHGGHLTHGSAVNFSGKLYNFVHYGVDRKSEVIDYEDVRQLAIKHRPKLIVAGATAYTRLIDFHRFRQIADEIDAKLMVDMAHISGLIAGGAHPSPVPHAQVVTSTTQKTLRGPRGGMILSTEEIGKKVDYGVFPFSQGGPFMHVIAAKAVCFGEASKPEFAHYAEQVVVNAKSMALELSEAGLRLVSGGTDNHLLLVDLNPLDITGRAAEAALEAVGIVANKNAIPFDEKPPRVTSGLRLGTPAITSRGFKEKETKQVAHLIVDTLTNIGDESAMTRISEEVKSLTSQFPVPGIDL